MEELLKKLIALGREPRGNTLDVGVINIKVEMGDVIGYDLLPYGKPSDGVIKRIFTYSLNDLCSLDSGLWQFVCEKGYYKLKGIAYENINKTMFEDFELLLMLSSINNDKQQFLKDNIKLD